MNILGVRYGHDASAALIIDGQIIADVAEERFTRVKNDASFPINSIQYCLKAGNINSKELDCLAIPTTFVQDAFHSFFSIPEPILPQTQNKTARGLRKYIGNVFSEKILKDQIYSSSISPVLPLYQKPLELSETCKIYFVEHHLAHAASACYTSGIHGEKALVVTMDGVGDLVSNAIWRFENNCIESLKKFDNTSSLGWFYANATEAMGWRQSCDEWKLMGLAPYGTAQPKALLGFYPEFKNGDLVKQHNYGEFGRWNDHGAIHYHGKDAFKLNRLVHELGIENFSAEVQRVIEEQAFNIILPWLEKENTRHLICSGGCFMNVKLNQKLWNTGKLDTHWIYPNAGDAGIALGSALHAYYTTYPDKQHQKLTHLYSGPEYTNAEIKEILIGRGLVYKYVENPSEVAAKYLVRNYVVGWFQGRMEAGSRALGNRSILMSPLKAENKNILNHKIKFREHFRPFAPAVIIEKMHDYFVNPREEGFMTCSFDVVQEKRESIPAVVHVDGTARPQMVSREANPRFYDLIRGFGELTGEYVVLNTSFNVKGEPIVQHPREALKCFFDTGMDVLIINNYVIEKPALQV
jgi:carbamoyltransferase